MKNVVAYNNSFVASQIKEAHFMSKQLQHLQLLINKLAKYKFGFVR